MEKDKRGEKGGEKRGVQEGEWEQERRRSRERLGKGERAECGGKIRKKILEGGRCSRGKEGNTRRGMGRGE